MKKRAPSFRHSFSKDEMIIIPLNNITVVDAGNFACVTSRMYTNFTRIYDSKSPKVKRSLVQERKETFPKTSCSPLNTSAPYKYPR